MRYRLCKTHPKDVVDDVSANVQGEVEIGEESDEAETSWLPFVDYEDTTFMDTLDVLREEVPEHRCDFSVIRFGCSVQTEPCSRY